MSSPKLRKVNILLVVVATFTVASWALVRSRPHGYIQIIAEKAPPPNEDGLVLDVNFPSIDDQARLAYPVDRRPVGHLLPRGVFTNPLMGDALSIVLRNDSGENVDLANGGRLWITVDLRDAQGARPTFRHGSPSGIKWLGTRLPGANVVTLAAGKRIERGNRIWGGLDPRDPPAPGTYTARIECRYIRESDGSERVVESAPIVVNATARDVANYRALATTIEGNWPNPRDAVGLVLDAVRLLRW